MNCPEPSCRNYDKPMRVAYENNYQRLYKCPTCGHMVLVDMEDKVKQQWKRDDIHG